MAKDTVVKTDPDPTENVRALVVSGLQRQDDLRGAESRRVDDALRCINETLVAAAAHSDDLRVAEAKRIDAIRAVDVAAVAVANERATAQATVLANQVAISAETLRALVAATASTTAQQFSTLTTQITDRLALLEKSQNRGEGAGGGMRDLYGWLVGVLMFVVASGSVLWNIFGAHR